MATTLEAKLRISADTAQASAAVKQLGKDAGAIPVGVAPAGKALDDLGKKTEENTKRMKDAAYRLSLLRPQITDIVTGLATGQSPFTILLQQGGQLGDVFGGFGNALKALGTVFTPFRLLLGGVAAALGTVAFQAIAGANESDALRKSLALTGNVAGTSAGQLDTLARSNAAATKASIGDSREALAEIVASGQFSGAAIGTVHRAVLALGKLNGQTSAENLKQFTSLADGLTAGATKLNRQYNFLTADQIRFVQTLEAQGRTQEAVSFITKELAQTLESRGVPAVGLFESAWSKVKGVLSGVLDDLKAIVRDTTAEDKLAKLNKELAALQQFGTGGGRRKSTQDALVAAKQGEVDAATNELGRAQLRASEKAIALQDEQDKAAKLTKAYQDSLSAITQAGAQKRLAGELAAIERRKSALEADHAKGLVSEREFAARSSAIDIERLRAQRTALQTTLASERAKLVKGGDSQEQNAQQARVLQLEAQLTEMGTRIQAATAKAGADVLANQLAEARSQAQAYAEVWQRAAEQVRSFAQGAAEVSARLLADPARRAQAEADAATASLREQQAATERDLGNQIGLAKDPNQAAELQRQLDALRAGASQAIAEAGRAVQLRSLQAQAAEAQAQLSAQEQAIGLRVQAGQITEAEGESQVLGLRREQLPVLERILALIEAIATTPEEKSQAANLRNTVTAYGDLRTELEKTARSQAVSGLSSALSDIATRAKTGKEALQDMVAGFAKAMLDVLSRRLADQLVNQFIDAAGKGGLGELIGKGIKFVAGLFHSGGVVGGGAAQHRAVNPLAFALAPRYHSGNTGDLMRRMGVRSNERAVIVEDDEEILSAKNPRHIRNFRGGGAGGINSTVNVSVTAPAGDQADALQFGNGLGRAVEAFVENYVINQHRPGGLFARR